MLDQIMDSLARQVRALDLLNFLQAEEFSRLKDLKPKSVTEIEFSIQELIRQVAAEREWVKTLLGGRKLRELKEELRPIMPEKMDELASLLSNVDAREQACAIQAEHNSALALALMDQSQSMLEFLHKQVAPKKQDGYSAKGRMLHQDKPEASILRGRL